MNLYCTWPHFCELPNQDIRNIFPKFQIRLEILMVMIIHDSEKCFSSLTNIFICRRARLTSSVQMWKLFSRAMSSAVNPAPFSRVARSGRVLSRSLIHSVRFNCAHRCRAVSPRRVGVDRVGLGRGHFLEKILLLSK